MILRTTAHGSLSAAVHQPESGGGTGINVDRHGITATLAAYEAAWNKHDLDAWGRLFTDDVDYVNRAGGLWSGNQANIEGHRAIHAALQQQNQVMNWSADVTRISFPAPGVALVHATWNWPGYRLPSGEKPNGFRGIMTLLMVKRDNNWLIRALHNTVANPGH